MNIVNHFIVLPFQVISRKHNQFYIWLIKLNCEHFYRPSTRSSTLLIYTFITARGGRERGQCSAHFYSPALYVERQHRLLISLVQEHSAAVMSGHVVHHLPPGSVVAAAFCCSTASQQTCQPSDHVHCARLLSYPHRTCFM